MDPSSFASTLFFGRGERGDAIAGALTGLRTGATGAQMSHLLPALDTALSAMA